MATDGHSIWGDIAACAFVQASHLFKSLDDEAAHDLLKLGETRVYAAGEVVAPQGEPDDEFLLIKDGSASVVAERDGVAHELSHLEKGGLFGEHGLLTGEPRPATLL